MSLRSELDAMQKQRAREVAIKIALTAMDEKSTPTAPSAIEKSIETCQGRQEISAEAAAADGSSPVESVADDLELPPYSAATSPARICKPWEDYPGHQSRPMTRYEREAVEMAEFDKAALADWEKHRQLQQEDADALVWETDAVAKRRAKELRTGRRPLPDQRIRGTYIGPQEPTPPAGNPWDNKRQSGRFGAD